MLAEGKGYEYVMKNFQWPHVQAGLQEYNIGVDICDKWAKSEKKDVRRPKQSRRRWSCCGC